MVRKWSARMVCLTVSSSRPRKGGSSSTITNTNNVRRVAIKWTKSKRWRASTYCLPSDSNPRHGESFSFGPNDYVLDNEFEDESSTGRDKAFYFLILFISLRVLYYSSLFVCNKLLSYFVSPVYSSFRCWNRTRDFVLPCFWLFI